MRDLPIDFAAPMVRALLTHKKNRTRRLASSRVWAGCQVGCGLWVREAWDRSDDDRVSYGADFDSGLKPAGVSWRSAALMPKRFSRIQLRVNEVRVEPLQSMTEEDAHAEGIEPPRDHNGLIIPAPAEYIATSGNALEDHRRMCGPRAHFAAFWDTLHDKDGERWVDNPEVVVLTFTAERLGGLRP